MFRSLSVIPHCYHYVTSSRLKQMKSNLKLGLLITFHYHSIFCHSQKIKSSTATPVSFVQMADHLSTKTSNDFVTNIDRYRGVHIKSIENPFDANTFAAKLEASLRDWTSQKLQAVWFSVKLEHSDWIPILAKNGFRFHHCGQDGGEVSLVRWLPPEPSRIPVFAHTMVGVGAVVVNSDKKILVVQESYRGQPYWKLPGGYIEPGEDIPEAAMREVLEETNIKTEFKSLVAFRHSHTAQFSCSDVYFIVELAPLSSDITSCEIEIEDSQWMDIDTYLTHPNVHENNRLFLQKYLFSKEVGLSINGTKTFHPVTKSPQMLYALGPLE